MPRQQVEFEFPDPDKEEEQGVEIEVELPEEEETVEVEPAVGRENLTKQKKTEKEVIKADDIEIEVEDDTPPEDRGRKPSEPPEAVTDEELENYSEKVKNRIKHFSKGYHDERRAKEEAMREREAMEQYAKQLVEENQKLKGKTDQSHNALIEAAKKQVASELAVAQQQYRQAYESGEPDAVLTAQQALNIAQIRADKVNNLKPKVVEEVSETSLQSIPNQVQQQESPPQPQAPVQDKKSQAWRDENPWFGNGPEGDREMTAFALGVHDKLTQEYGVDPRSDEYYEKINARMRQVFPAYFNDGIEDEPEETPKTKSSNVVAPATRSTGPKKVRLTQSQVAIAKRLGVPLEQYAKQAAQLSRNS